MVMQLLCMHDTMSTRKVERDDRQRHAKSEVEQVVSGDESMQSLMLMEMLVEAEGVREVKEKNLPLWKADLGLCL